jgi:DNA modification methylase
MTKENIKGSLTLMPEIEISYSGGTKKPLSPISGSEMAADYIRSLFPKGEIELQEQVIVLYLNRANVPIGYHRHTKGTITQGLIDVRIILGVALKCLSVGMIIAHNHPSGNTKPSPADLDMTKRLKASAKLMQINLLDHIIITKDSYYSMSDNGDIEQEVLNGIKKLPALNTVICGNTIETMRTFPDASIDCIVTSPPYWQLRDYGWKGQWGLERTYKEYLAHLWAFMDEAWRILKPQGTVWINLGDTYFGSGNGSGRHDKMMNYQSITKGATKNVVPTVANTASENKLKAKCQVLIPHRFAVGCIERGWIVRNDIIWAKPNSLPESTKDRFAKKHEHIFLLVKNKDYYFDLDAVRDPHKNSSLDRAQYGMTAYGGDKKNKKGAMGKGIKGGGTLKKIKLNAKGKNPGDVTDFWRISTKACHANHYAAFNRELITKPILAGCPKGGIVLDPFCGTAVTGIAAIELGRKFIGIEGKKEYCTIARKNLEQAEKGAHSRVKKLVTELKNLSFSKAA